jgi:2-polyprenyl-3-methyl-5-hydroxy-6-metoxy-1,4-benzoquinol methylase
VLGGGLRFVHRPGNADGLSLADCAAQPLQFLAGQEPLAAAFFELVDAARRIGALRHDARQLILESVGDVSGCRVLDIGCGDGEFALELSRRGAIVTGIDASAAMIDAAKDRAKQHNADVTFQVRRIRPSL